MTTRIGPSLARSAATQPTSRCGLALRAEIPIVNSASTDPTIVETLIPWYFTVLQDDRTQGYTLARHIYTDLGLKRIALLRVNDRYGRFGVGKFRDASRRLGHPVVIEQKFSPERHRFHPPVKGDQRIAGRRHRAVDRPAQGSDDPEADAGTGHEAARSSAAIARWATS